MALLALAVLVAKVSVDAGAPRFEGGKRPLGRIQGGVDIRSGHRGTQEHVVPRMHVNPALEHLAAPGKADAKIRILIE